MPNKYDNYNPPFLTGDNNLTAESNRKFEADRQAKLDKERSAGIDYGNGTTNIDNGTGIRYGVISLHDVTQAWCDSSEPNYGEPHCPKCGNKAVTIDDESVPEIDGNDEWNDEGRDHACVDCCYSFDSSEAYGDDPISHDLDDGEYLATQGWDDSDIFIIKSPYYTLCQFCSPCAPGAGYIVNSVKDGVKAYCFGHDWFDDGKAPYPVYSVATGKLVEPDYGDN